MPHLYFCEPDNQSHGTLRAVLSWEECDHVVDRASAIRLGDEFPVGSINANGQTTVAVLYVRPEEANEKWFAGFYRMNVEVTEITKTLRILNRIPANVGP